MSRVQRIESGYAAREPFVPFHMRKQRWACIVAHRRAGKTVACVADLFDAALRCTKPNPRFAYIAPYYAQAKDVAWTYLKQYGGLIPGAQMNETELRLDLPNGARIRLYGADNYDRLRGIYLDGAILDEYGDWDPRVYPEVIRPALADRKGWGVFIGTPKGRNGFYDIHRHAAQSDDWFSMVLRSSESGLVDEDELADARSMMTPEQYEREFECSFDAAIPGVYYARQIADARKEGRIGKVPRDPLMEVRAYWDIGGTGAKADATAIWLVQFVGKEIRWLDHYEASGQPLEAHVNWLRSRGYQIKTCVLPHDGAQHDRVYAVTYEGALRAAGFEVITVPNQGRGAAMQRVEALRRLFPACWFNEPDTGDGLSALGWYHAKKNEAGHDMGPEHDWSSHSADAAGLVAVAYNLHGPETKMPQWKAPSFLIA